MKTETGTGIDKNTDTNMDTYLYFLAKAVQYSAMQQTLVQFDAV